MTFFLIGASLAMGTLIARRQLFVTSNVETRTMRSLKAALRRAEDSPRGRILALSRMM